MGIWNTLICIKFLNSWRLVSITSTNIWRTKPFFAVIIAPIINFWFISPNTSSRTIEPIDRFFWFFSSIWWIWSSFGRTRSWICTWIWWLCSFCIIVWGNSYIWTSSKIFLISNSISTKFCDWITSPTVSCDVGPLEKKIILI